MNIQGIAEAYGARLYTPANAKKRVVAEDGTAGAKKEQVEISALSEQLQMVKRRMGEVPEIRLDVVQRIKARIKMNDYPIENSLNETLKMLMSTDLVEA